MREAMAQSDPNEERFWKLMGGLSKLCRTELDEETIGLYDQVLVAEFGYARVCDALQKVIMERDSRDAFPSIKEIRAILDPQADTESAAVMAANVICERVALDGWTNSDRAKERMGPLAWRVVQLCGGWPQVCSMLNEKNMTQMRAQFRDAAKALQKQGLVGPAHTQIEDKGPAPKQLSYGELVKMAKDKGGSK